MIWKKLGKIFDPTKANLFNNCKEFAQSPQTIVFDNFVRIYFSTRNRDEKGEYLSHIAFIDMDLEMKNIINQSAKQVISLGKLGTYDEHGIFPIHLFKDENKIYAFPSGWNRRVATPVETGIGLASSKDNGETFERIGNGPVLSATIDEPFLVGDGFVQKFDNKYHMWYIFGTHWLAKTNDEPVARIYKIGHATSLDLINWTKTNKKIIVDVLNENECQALPTVIKINNTYHMYFCFREATDFRTNPKRAYKLGYAFSYDLINWTRNDELGGMKTDDKGNNWDSDMQCYPHVFQVKNKVYILYNGNEFGKFGFGLAELISE